MAIITSESVFPPNPVVFSIVNGTATVTESALINPPSNVVRTTEAWEVRFHWETTGILNDTITGTWHLEVFLERMGPLEAPVLAGTTKNVALTPVLVGNSVYDETLPFAAGLVPAGLYQVTAIITMDGPLNNPKPIAGFADLGLVQFYVSP